MSRSRSESRTLLSERAKGEAARLRINEPPFAYLSHPRLLDRNQGFWSICLQALLAYTMHTPRMLVAAAVCRNAQPYVAAASRRPFWVWYVLRVIDVDGLCIIQADNCCFPEVDISKHPVHCPSFLPSFPTFSFTPATYKVTRQSTISLNKHSPSAPCFTFLTNQTILFQTSS
jgi:hypothetical protein